MITVEMSVATYDDTLPMDVTSSNETVDMTIGATYAMTEGDPYEGSYEVTPKAWEAQTLATKDKLMEDDVTVFKIPYYETSNIFDGLTVFIAEDING